MCEITSSLSSVDCKLETFIRPWYSEIPSKQLVLSLYTDIYKIKSFFAWNNEACIKTCFLSCFHVLKFVMVQVCGIMWQLIVAQKRYIYFNFKDRSLLTYSVDRVHVPVYHMDSLSVLYHPVENDDIGHV